MSQKPLLVLFDIDGTLVDTQGQGASAFLSAVRELWDIDDDLSWMTFAGATDLDLLDQIGRKFGMRDPALFFENYAARMRKSMDPEQVRVLPGVREILNQLHEHPDISLGLVTGNARETAYLKIAAAGLDHYFPDGGFGDEHPVRAELVGLALDRLKRAGEGQLNCALVGDTPKDILAAVVAEVLPIGVATGRYTMEELKKVHKKSMVIDHMNGLVGCLNDHFLVKYL